MSYTRKVTYVSSSGCGKRTSTTTVIRMPCQQTQVVAQKVQTVSTPQGTSSKKDESVKKTTDSGTKTSALSFNDAVLREHNRLRAKHSAAPLTLDAAICRYAQEWANYIASRNVMQHRSKNSYGENIYASFGKASVQGEEVVMAWYKEIKDYRFGQSNPANFSKVGHFTQVVWKNSKRLGVGIARNGNNIYVVCNYDPPGNYGGQYPANVTQC